MGVVFLASALLAGLAVLALPLLIHLISKRRARRVRFGAIDFVLKSQRRSARNLRLRQILLLLVRTALLALVVLAVARPVFREAPRAVASGAPLVVVIALDESASMHATLDGRSAFERAKDKAEDLVSSLPEDVRLSLLACGEPVRDVLPEPGFDRSALLRALDEMEAGYGRSDLAACVARGHDIAARVEGQGERRVAVFSDLARHALPGGAASAKADGLVVEWVAAFDEEPPPNHGLSQLAAERVPGAEGDAVEIRFTVARHGGTPVEVPADLFVDGARAARLSIPLEPGQRVARSFTHDFGAKGGERERAPEAVVRLGDDALEVDNEAQLPVEIPPPVRVLVVDGAPQPIPFRDEVFYLESALAQYKKARARVRVDVVGAEQVNAGLLTGTRVVVLANVSRIDDTAARALVEFVKAGGGLLITSGDQVDVDWYNAALAEVLPARLRGAKGQALLDDAQVAEKLGLSRFQQEHPIFKGIAGDDDGSLPGLRRVETHTLMLVEPDADAPREVLMRFTNEAPALLERRVDAGRVALLATTVDRDWTDLPIRPGFLPLVQQTVLYLAGALDAAGPRFLDVGQPCSLLLPRGAELLEVRAPGGEAFRLGSKDASAARADGASELRFLETHAPGLYRVYVKYSGGELKEMPGERFTVLIDAAESDLTRASEEALAEAVPHGAEVRGGAARDDDVPLWPPLLLAAVALLLLEAWMLRRT